ncbi:MAG: cysteine synthase A [Methylococcales bacterium]|jgi:cysteine synthase|nr:cysteine synthase A [Methylococcales bacterium]MBT7445955.1 cysteine synthase A [Methylococcales bacterium]
MNIAENISDLIGNTPLIKLNALSQQSGATILGKCEFLNPTSSIKDRIGCSMIDAAIGQGLIKPDTTIIEPTSGNTGIALASICAAKNLRLILTMPESMSTERRNLLTALGAELVLTPALKGMTGACDKAIELANSIANTYIPQQFKNPANAQIHRETTGKEILADTDNKVDIFISGVGTGGTITGCGETLRQANSDVQIIAVEPSTSAILSGGTPGLHKIQGIGAGFTPDILNCDIFNEVIQVSDDDAYITANQLAKKEGLLVGVSSGANAFAAAQVARRPENQGKMIVTLLCDTGERYLSASLY